MERAPSRTRTKEITREAFEHLLARLDPDRERAGEKYEALRQRLIKFFVWWGSEFPEDHADQTFDRVLRKIVEGEQIEDINKYVGGVARRLYSEHVKERVRNRNALKSLPSFENSSKEEVLKQARLECYEECLRQLPKPSHDLVFKYYREHADQRQIMADEMGIPVSLLRVRAFRIRKELKTCLSECLRRRDVEM